MGVPVGTGIRAHRARLRAGTGRRRAAWKVAGALVLVLNAALGAQLGAPATALAASPAVDWPMYLQNPQLTAASSETILSAAGAPNLRPLWTYKTGGVIAASPTIVGGVAYVGSWDGYEYALNASTGALIWKTFIGTTTAPQCSPPALGVSSTANVSNGTVYVGGGDGNWYALSAATGQVLWSIPIGNPANGYYNWASPLIYGNSVYIGVASLGDCPLVQGQLLRVDLTTHAVMATASLVPGGQVGGGVWTTPSIDPATNIVYVTTGTLNQSTQAYSEAMVALDATSLSILSSWQIPQSTMNADSDWGDSPILFTDSTGRALVAGINKNGFLYAFLRSNIAAGPVWYDQVAVSGICPTCGDGSVSSMAFAQGLLYAAGGNTTINGVGYPGAVRAVDPGTGNVVWARGLASPVIPALAYDNGMVFAGAGKYLEVLDAATGNVLSSYQTGAVTYSPPSVSNGTVYMGSGDGTVFAFAPVTPTTPPVDASCPTGWTCQDVGSPAPAGSETVRAGSWSIAAGGAGLGLAGGTDQLRLMSQAVSGDAQITARVTGHTGERNADRAHGPAGERSGLAVLRRHVQRRRHRLREVPDGLPGGRQERAGHRARAAVLPGDPAGRGHARGGDVARRFHVHARRRQHGERRRADHGDGRPGRGVRHERNGHGLDRGHGRDRPARRAAEPAAVVIAMSRRLDVHRHRQPGERSATSRSAAGSGRFPERGSGTLATPTSCTTSTRPSPVTRRSSPTSLPSRTRRARRPASSSGPTRRLRARSPTASS